MAVKMSTHTERYIGASTDTKPANVPVGSFFWEYDTNVLYVSYDGTNWTVCTVSE